MALSDCRIIELPRIQDHRGNLSIVEAGRQIPFDIKRVYYLYDIPGELHAPVTPIASCTSSWSRCRALST